MDGIQYRWMAKRRDDHPHDPHGPMTFLVFYAHLDKHPADSTLRVTLYERHVGRAVTPEVAVTLIRGARKRGWNPTTKGTYEIDSERAISVLGDA